MAGEEDRFGGVGGVRLGIGDLLNLMTALPISILPSLAHTHKGEEEE